MSFCAAAASSPAALPAEHSSMITGAVDVGVGGVPPVPVGITKTPPVPSRGGAVKLPPLPVRAGGPGTIPGAPPFEPAGAPDVLAEQALAAPAINASKATRTASM